MTTRDFFKAIVEKAIDDELTTYAQTELQKMDERNAKRRERPSKAQLANEPYKVKIAELLNGSEGLNSTEIAEKVGVTTAKANGILQSMVKEGKIAANQVKVKGKGFRNFYTIAANN